MHLAVMALGTRGDVQPLIALSKGLQAAGHHVVMIAGVNFEEWITSHGLEFVPSIDIEATMSSEKGLAWTEGSDNPMQQLQIMRNLLNEHGEKLYAPILEAATTADFFISGFTSEPFVQSVSEWSGKPYLSALLQPYHATRSGAASLAPIMPRQQSPLNYWMGRMAERLIWSVAADITNRLRRERLNLPPHTAKSYRNARQSTPTIFGFSRHVVPPAPDWREMSVMSGYWFLDEESGWQPSPDLSAFLRNGSPPIYIGFGSMSSRDPSATLSLILDAVGQTDQRAVIAAGWSGARADTLPDHSFLIDKAPHSWLFERVAAVVHHGGAGTTGAGLRAGKPTMIIPHMSDQPYWARRVEELGAGVKAVPRRKLTSRALAAGIGALTKTRGLQERAAQLGERIRLETGVATAVEAVERFAR